MAWSISLCRWFVARKHVQYLIMRAARLSKPQGFRALDDKLLWGWRDLEQLEDFIQELIQRHGVFVIFLPKQRGAHTRRCKLDHLDGRGLQLHAKTLSERMNGRFGCAVGRRCRQWDECQSRTDIDDRRTGLLDQLRYECVHHTNRAKQVRRHDSFGGAQVFRFSQILPLHDASVVYQHVQVWVTDRKRFAGALDGVWIADVQQYRFNTWMFRHDLVEQRLAPSRDDDGVTRLVKPQRQAKAYA